MVRYPPAVQGLQSAAAFEPRFGENPELDPLGINLQQRGMDSFNQGQREQQALTGFSGGVAPDRGMEGFLQAMKEKDAAVTPSGGVSSPGSNQLVGRGQQPGPPQIMRRGKVIQGLQAAGPSVTGVS